MSEKFERLKTINITRSRFPGILKVPAIWNPNTHVGRLEPKSKHAYCTVVDIMLVGSQAILVIAVIDY